MSLAHAPQPNLLRSRNQIVAKSFYEKLRSEGFSPEQIIDLSATLIGPSSPTRDLGETPQAK